MATKRATKSRKRNGGGARRTTSTRQHPDLAMFDGVCRQILATQGRDVLPAGDP